MRENIGYINSTEGTSSEKDAPSPAVYISFISGTLGDTGMYCVYALDKINFYSEILILRS